LAPVPPDLGRRIASALVLAPLGIAAVWLGGWPFYAMLALVTAILTWEWLRLYGSSSSPAPRPLPSWPGLTRPSTHDRTSAWTAGTAVLLLAAAAFAWLRADPTAGRANAFFLLAIVWATDIAAYLTGRAAKGPKLAPRISPAKTWSGAAGGIAAAICTGLITAAITATSLPHAAAIAAALSIIAQAGDLGESAVKRRFGVKDSSRLIPGHGGALDRLDSTLAVSLAAALLVILRGRGVVLWA
jgi:phosphatidate cytidylyltransferase